MGAALASLDLEPPAFLALAGHPLRWRLLGELGRSDRTVHELTGLVGEPQNLVSYHLGKLRDARLVASRRSSADRRGSYYSVDLARVRTALAATGTALHPGLDLVARRAVPAPDGLPAQVLFLCTGNSARSQMAEALARARSAGRVEAHSAGSHPKALHPYAVQVMRDDYGIDIAGQRPKPLSEFAAHRFDRVVSLCDRVREVCPDPPGWPEPTHWSIADPAAGAGGGGDARADGAGVLEAFRRTAAELDRRLEFLLAPLAHPARAEERKP